MKKLLGVFTSLKTTPVLFLWLLVVLGLSTLISHPLLTVPESPLFLVPASLFFLHLLGCTLKRIYLKKSWRSLKKSGPDLLHLGILLLIAALFSSELLSSEEMLTAAPGDRIELENTKTFTLIDADVLTDEAGSLLRQFVLLEDTEKHVYRLETNQPHRQGAQRITLLDLSYLPVFYGQMENASGPVSPEAPRTIRLLPEQAVHTSLGPIRFAGIIEKAENWQVRLERNGVYTLLSPGETLGPLTYRSVDIQKQARLLYSFHPLYILYPAAFLLAAAGLLLILLRILTDQTRSPQ